MARPKKDDREATRLRLLHAAEQEFGSHGFAGARLEDIAAAAGVRRSSLLYHFSSKAALWTEVVDSVSQEMMRVIAAAIAGPTSVASRIEAVVDTLVSFASSRKGAVSMFVRELLDGAPNSQEHMPKVVLMVDMIESFVQREGGHLIPPGAPLRSAIVHLLTAGALRIASGNIGDQLFGPKDDPRNFIRALLKISESRHAS